MLLFVFVLPTMCLAQEIFRGGEVILSTRHDYNTVQAYLDTVLVFARENHTQNCKVYSLEPGSSVWDSASVVGQTAADQSQRTAFLAGSGSVRYSQDSVARTIWTCKTAKDVVFHSNEDTSAPIDKYSVSKLTAHPYLPGVLIAEHYVYDQMFRNHENLGYVSLDAGSSWKSIASVSAIEFFVSFDPKFLLNVSITQAHGPFSASYFNVLKTTDLFSTNVRFSLSDLTPNRTILGLGFGMWSRIGSIEQGQPYGLNRSDWKLLSDSLYLPPNSPPTLVTLPWRENARRSFYPDLDTTTEKFSYWSEEMAYHIDQPKLIVINFIYEGYVGNLYEQSIVVGASTDLGETWTQLAKLPYH